MTGLQGLPGERGPAGSPGAIRVFDANNQYLGIFVHNDPPTRLLRIFVPALNAFVDLDWTTGSLHFAPLYYQGTNCTGTPYFNTERSGAPFPQSITGNNNAAYRMDGNPIFFYYQSVGYNYSPGVYACVSMNGSAWGYAAEPVSEQNILLSLPAALPIRYEAE
jgi:hypothetical protein